MNVPNPFDLLSGLTGQKGLETAAAGARDAQKQANALADLQWQRQMMGLQEARGQTQPYLSLYDKIYGTRNAGNVTPVSGIRSPGIGGSGTVTGAGGTTGPNPYGTGRGVTPDGSRPPSGQDEWLRAGVFGDSKPVFAPPTVGRPPGATPPASGAGAAAPVNFNQPVAPVQPNGMNNGLAQLLAALGYR